ncbi:hypothetical protein [Erwinia piriflorinigrans]|uniref:Nitroreductase domain-containing protein n=1 Tax=Erwinia piriflorinigrans CFBP 5888 TaxID=1161919 RepID=V5Z9J6_9GAMM|nr:hypothetical protein [Erwinia piriflorinigrans]CCG87610.1 hypothetical protein EPIR_2245 [Erwinia piriflorinigrans CFBP 5888]
MCSHTIFSPAILINRHSVLPEELIPLKEALGWTCGKKNSSHNGIQKRYIPSAGARYPTEVLALYLADGVYQLYYYDVDEHKMYSTFNSGQAGLGEIFADHKANEKEVVIIFASVLWRTLERYGLRGYRYCLIETGCMASQLNKTTGAVNGHIALKTPTENLDKHLGLSCSTPAMATCKLELNSLKGVKKFKIAEKKGVQYIDEQTPTMNPLLKRVEKFHRKAMKKVTRIAVPASMSFSEYEKRESANHFSERLLSNDDISLIKRHLVEQCRNHENERHEHLDIVILSVDEDKFINPVMLWVRNEGVKEISLPYRSVDISSFTDNVFQQQEIVKRSSVIVMVGMSTCLTDCFDYGYFSRMSLKAGMLIADLYRLADSADIGTTTIGGFSDAQFVGKLGLDNFYPLIAQIYGKTSERDIKEDSRVLLTSERF